MAHFILEDGDAVGEKVDGETLSAHEMNTTSRCLRDVKEVILSGGYTGRADTEVEYDGDTYVLTDADGLVDWEQTFALLDAMAAGAGGGSGTSITVGSNTFKFDSVDDAPVVNSEIGAFINIDTGDDSAADTSFVVSKGRSDSDGTGDPATQLFRVRKDGDSAIKGQLIIGGKAGGTGLWLVEGAAALSGDVSVGLDLGVLGNAHVVGDLEVDGTITGTFDVPDADGSTAGLVNLDPQRLGDGQKDVEALGLDESTPSNPSAGVVLYSSAGIRKTPIYRSPGAVRPTVLGSHLGTKRVCWRQAAGMGSTAISLWGLTTVSTGGLSSVNMTSTNIRTQQRRVQYDTTSAASNSNGFRWGDLTHWRGNAAGLGGFHAFQYFGFNLTGPADSRFFTGFRATVAQVGATVDPSALTDMVGLGFDAADTNFYFMHNDNAGTATRVDTTLAPSTTEYYELQIFAEPNASEIRISLTALGAGTVVTATLSSNLPTSTSFLGWHFHVNSGPTGGSAHGSDWSDTWIESDY